MEQWACRGNIPTGKHPSYKGNAFRHQHDLVPLQTLILMHVLPVFLGLWWSGDTAMGCELLYLILFLPLRCPWTPIRLGHLGRGLNYRGLLLSSWCWWFCFYFRSWPFAFERNTSELGVHQEAPNFHLSPWTELLNVWPKRSNIQVSRDYHNQFNTTYLVSQCPIPHAPSWRRQLPGMLPWCCREEESQGSWEEFFSTNRASAASSFLSHSKTTTTESCLVALGACKGNGIR